MGLLVTLQNYRAAAFPVEEKSYVWAESAPRVGEYIHLHDQSRIAEVNAVVWMAQETQGARKPAHPGAAALVIVVTGTNPERPFDGRY